MHENVFPLDAVVYLQKGRPLLDRFSVVIRRCIETGLVGKYWSELNFNPHLQNTGKFETPTCVVFSNTILVFSLSHTRMAFVVLRFG